MCVVGHVHVLVFCSVGLLVGERRGHVWCLVVARVVTNLCVELVGTVEIAQTTTNIEEMCIEATIPVEIGVAHDDGLLTRQCCTAVVHTSDALHVVAWHTVRRKIIVLVGVDKAEGKVLSDAPKAVDVPLRANGERDGAVTEVVTVVAITIAKNGNWVGKRSAIAVVGEYVVQIIVGLSNVVRHVSLCIESEWREERSLDEAEERWRRDDSVGDVVLDSIVAHVAGDIAVAGIETNGCLARKTDVSVEAHVKTRVVGILERSVSEGIAYGEVVVCHVVTTLHVDAVVLSERLVIDLLAPVGVVMELSVIVVIRVGVEELERVGLGSCGSDEFGRIHAELFSIHHIHFLWNEFVTATDAEVDACCHRLVTLGFNHYHTVGCLGSVDGGTILQH